MNLDPDEKELLESFERGEWRSVHGDEAARLRELVRERTPRCADVEAGFDPPLDGGPTDDEQPA